MAAMPEGSVDGIVTDPPYAFDTAGKVQTRSGVAADLLDPHAEQMNTGVSGWIKPAVRLLKAGCGFTSFCDAKAVSYLWQDCLEAELRPLAVVGWIKANPPPQPRKNFQSALELGVYARKPGPVAYWGGGGASPSATRHSIPGRTERHLGTVNHHRAVKSLDLLRRLIRITVAPGGLVLDPFCGSGSTLVAALLEGRYALGIEIDQIEGGKPAGYAGVIAGRLAAWSNLIDVFTMTESGQIPDTKDFLEWAKLKGWI